MQAGPYVDGKLHGRWVKQGADCYFAEWRRGEKVNEGSC